MSNTLELLDTDLAPPNAAGEIALKTIVPGQLITPRINGNQYIFSPRANIFLAWIKPQDVSFVLDIKGGCNCGGVKKKIITRANVADVRRWLAGGGR
jgi:hypothetical protein